MSRIFNRGCSVFLASCILLLPAACRRSDPARPVSETAKVARPTESNVDLATLPETPTFSEHIAPLVFENCSPCHRPGGPGPFDLLTYRDVAKRAEQIADVTRRRFMPPWLPEPGYGEFSGERRLTADEIALLQRWATTGAKRGDPELQPVAPTWSEGWQLGQPDLVAEMPEAYPLPAEGRDDFRNFVIPIPSTTTRYVRTLELRADNPKVIHHATMWIDRTRQSRRIDLEDTTPGYSSMDPRMSAEDPDGHFLGWTPGSVPFAGTDDLAWRLDPGTDLVLQLHMLPTGKPESVRCKVGFFFADGPPAHLPFMLRLGSKAIDIPAGESSYTIEDSYRLPVDVEVLGLRPHAHYLATRMEAWATLEDGERRWLLGMNWDFNWQEEYRYREPIALPAGTVLAMRYTYDNSADNIANPQHPPERVTFGPYSSDEMGDLWLQVLPRSASDRQVLEQSFHRKEREALIAGYEFALSVEDDPSTRVDLAVVLNAAGRRDAAIAQYRSALEARPDYAQAHNNLGGLLADAGEIGAAIEHYRQALELDPTFFEAYNNLGAVALQQGRNAEATGYYQRGLELNPDDAKAHNNLGALLVEQGDTVGAVEHYRRAVALQPDYVPARYNLSLLLAGRGDLEEAESHLLKVVALQPDLAGAHYSLGLIAVQRNQLSQAVAHLRRALELDPGSRQTRRLLDQVQQNLAHEG